MGFNKVFEKVMVGAEDKAIKDLENKLIQLKHELVDNNLMSQEQKIDLRAELIKLNKALDDLVRKNVIQPKLKEAEGIELDKMASEAGKKYKEKKKVNETTVRDIDWDDEEKKLISALQQIDVAQFKHLILDTKALEKTLKKYIFQRKFTPKFKEIANKILGKI